MDAMLLTWVEIYGGAALYLQLAERTCRLVSCGDFPELCLSALDGGRSRR